MIKGKWYMTFKNLLLIVILLIGFMAFLPPKEESADTKSPTTQASDDAHESSVEIKYVLRVYPGNWYLPGMMIYNVGKPVENLRNVAAKFEELYPDTKIEFAGVPVVREWLVTQLSGRLAPDILSINVEDVWQDTHKGWFISLDDYLNQPNPFVEKGQPGSEKWWDLFKYQAITRGKAAPDGKMYCITLDMIETAIFYNKDIFSKVGIDAPGDWIEFLEIQNKLREAGYIPFLGVLDWMVDWGVDLVFDQLYYPVLEGIDIVKEPLREQYLQGYLDWDEIAFLHSKGLFTENDPRYQSLWRILKEWRTYWNKDVVSADVLRLFYTQKGAMLWNASMLVDRLVKDPDLAFEWGVFYPPPIPKEYNQYCDGHMMCVIGGAATQLTLTNSAIKDTNNPATSERLKRCIAFLQFLTIPENAELVINEIAMMLPNINGVEPHAALMPFHDILQRRYTTTKWYFTFDLKFNEIMNRMLLLYLNDGISEDEHMNWTQKNLNAAIDSIMKRKKIDFEGFEQKWQELKPVRQSMGMVEYED